MLAFISDLGISVSWSFGFGSTQGVAKNTVQYIQRNQTLFGCLAHVFDAVFNYVCEVLFRVAVAFEWYFWWCMGGLSLVGVLAVVALHVVSSHNMGQ